MGGRARGGWCAVAVAGAVSVTAALACAAAGAAVADEPQRFAFRAGDFTNPTRIDNPYLPLVPGTRLVLRGQVKVGREVTPHEVQITVTDLVKVIAGIRTVVVWELDVSDGEVEESEVAFFAQDDSGNVWNLGEYPEEYDGGKFRGAPSAWIAGKFGAVGGPMVLGRPSVGSPTYVMGSAPTVEFLDYAKVSSIGQRRCAPVGCHEDVLVVDEWAPLEQPGDGHQLKTYAKGVGLLRVDPVGGEELETLALAKIERLPAAAMAKARDTALQLDKRATTHARKTFADTAPASRAASGR